MRPARPVYIYSPELGNELARPVINLPLAKYYLLARPACISGSLAKQRLPARLLALYKSPLVLDNNDSAPLLYPSPVSILVLITISIAPTIILSSISSSTSIILLSPISIYISSSIYFTYSYVE